MFRAITQSKLNAAVSLTGWDEDVINLIFDITREVKSWRWQRRLFAETGASHRGKVIATRRCLSHNSWNKESCLCEEIQRKSATKKIKTNLYILSISETPIKDEVVV
ncbi:hypothetical protein J6590_008381 [Homalodisca vitripennis]|nr:hypothetical protein J6590_008381 [Homalodisca vitripennis]